MSTRTSTSPDTTLLKRCSIEGSLGKYLQVYYAVDENSSLSDICIDILQRIEAKMILLKSYEISEKKKVKLELNLGFFKSSLESEVVSKKPSSIVTQFVGGLGVIYRSLNLVNYDGINIVIDELDCISETINFAHFIKLVREYCSSDKIINLTFIFAGQRGLYSRLLSEDKSVERLVTHIPITKLCAEESEHIIDYASKTAYLPFSVDDDAKRAILKIAAGYPYEIHLLADAAFWHMDNDILITMKDVSEGLGHILRSDKHEKYLSYLSKMSQNQRIIMSILGKFESKEMPAKIQFDWVIQEASKISLSEPETNTLFEEIRNLGFIIIDFENNCLQFNDELFRLFILLRQKYLDTEHEEYDSEIETEPYTEDEVQNLVEYFEESEANLSWDVDETKHLLGY